VLVFEGGCWLVVGSPCYAMCVHTLCICIMHLAGFDRGLILDIGMVVDLDVEGSGLGWVGDAGLVWLGRDLD